MIKPRYDHPRALGVISRPPKDSIQPALPPRARPALYKNSTEAKEPSAAKMGGDGGCIATQREFMRGTYGSAHSKGGWAQGQNHGSGTTGGDAEHGDFTNRRRAIRVRSCALTGDALKAPVVSDAFGQLFNKLDVLEQLSSKSLPEAFSHIRGLRDLIDVKSTPPKGSSQDYVHGDGAPFCQCPLTGASFDGSEPFVIIRTTGWLLAQKAISELGERALQDEYGPFTKEDLVAAAPDPDDVREASRALAEKRAAAKAKKKAAKRAKAGVVADAPKPEKKRKVAPPAIGAAADIARQAKERTAQDHAQNPELGAMFHSDETNSKPDAATLFAATAPRRYNLN